MSSKSKINVTHTKIAQLRTTCTGSSALQKYIAMFKVYVSSLTVHSTLLFTIIFLQAVLL